MRSLPRAVRHEHRVQVIRLRESGSTHAAIAKQAGPSRTDMFDICKGHERGGEQPLHDAAQANAGWGKAGRCRGGRSDS